MHSMPRERVMFGIFCIGLHSSSNNGSQTDQHGDWEDENQQRQQQNEGERNKDDARYSRFPAKLLQSQSYGWRALLAAFDKDMLLPQPDEQRSEREAEGSKERGPHPAQLPDAMKTTVYKTRFGVFGTNGLLKRGRLSLWRDRDRVHGGMVGC